MNVWLIKAGEALPSDEPKDRLKRMGLLANELVRQGHSVTWFNSSFNHSRKVQRCHMDKTISISDQYKIKLIWSNSYKNVSIARIKHHIQTANKFSREASRMSKPDIIVCSMPTIELAEAAINYGRANSIPVVVDIRDLWPDIYEENLPWFASGLIRPYVWYSRHRLRKLLKNASSITALTREFLEWGLDYAQREKTGCDRVFNMGYKREEWSSENSYREWESHGINLGDSVVCFFGHLGRQFNFEPLIEAAKVLEKDSSVKFVICGKGESLPALEKTTEKLTNVIFPGWVNQNQIQSLLRISSVGIAPYRNSMNFVLNIPNKFGEYLSAGLPVLLGVEGAMLRLVKEYDCGYYYRNGEELAKMVSEIHSDANRRTQLRSNAGKLYESHFDADKVYREMVLYLEQIAMDKPNGK